MSINAIRTIPQTYLFITRLLDKATVPTRGSAEATGLDLYSTEEVVVPKRGSALVDLQIAMAVPPGCYGRVAPRSGLAVKRAIDVGAGVIDSDYHRTVKVLLFNFSDTDFKVEPKDHIAQLILENISSFVIVEVDSLDETARGKGGFGSTGVSHARRVVSP